MRPQISEYMFAWINSDTLAVSEWFLFLLHGMDNEYCSAARERSKFGLSMGAGLLLSESSEDDFAYLLRGSRSLLYGPEPDGALSFSFPPDLNEMSFSFPPDLGEMSFSFPPDLGEMSFSLSPDSGDLSSSYPAGPVNLMAEDPSSHPKQGDAFSTSLSYPSDAAFDGGMTSKGDIEQRGYRSNENVNEEQKPLIQQQRRESNVVVDEDSTSSMVVGISTQGLIVLLVIASHGTAAVVVFVALRRLGNRNGMGSDALALLLSESSNDSVSSSLASASPTMSGTQPQATAVAV